jgi:hypothetical protein
MLKESKESYSVIQTFSYEMLHRLWNVYIMRQKAQLPTLSDSVMVYAIADSVLSSKVLVREDALEFYYICLIFPFIILPRAKA